MALDYGQYRSDEYREIMYGTAGTDSGHWCLEATADIKYLSTQGTCTLVLEITNIHIF